MASYEIRVYDLTFDIEEFNVLDYEDYIALDFEEIYFLNSKESLLKQWVELSGVCEGYPYVVLDCKYKKPIIAGFYNSDDESYIMQYFNKRI